MTDIIAAVKQFTEAVGCTTDGYNVRQTALYIGLQLEEMAEKLESVFTKQSDTAYRLHQLSREFKSGIYDEDVLKADRAAMLDADIDLAWVTIGSAFSQGADVEGAAGEVARANLSKLVECDQHPWIVLPNGAEDGGSLVTRIPKFDGNCKKCNGIGLVAIKDENGKVCKPPEWTPPNIEPFVCKS